MSRRQAWTESGDRFDKALEDDEQEFTVEKTREVHRDGVSQPRV